MRVGRLTIVPVTWREACAWIEQHHRHHLPPRGGVFWLAVADEAREIVGVVTVGRPVARLLDDGWTLEVTRSATDGTRNANSALYAAAWRAARALGWRRLVTYTQAGETGASLRAAGYRVIAERPASPGWNRPGRPRVDRHPTGIERTLWEASSPADLVARIAAELADVPRGPIRPEDEPALDMDGELSPSINQKGSNS